MKFLIVFLLLFHSCLYAQSVTTQSTITKAQDPESTPSTTQVTTTVTTSDGMSESDGKIVAAIYSAYAKEAALIGTKITATSQNGLVNLSGSVTAQSQADQAVAVAQRIPGVKSVISNLNVLTNKPTITPRPNNY